MVPLQLRRATYRAPEVPTEPDLDKLDLAASLVRPVSPHDLRAPQNPLGWQCSSSPPFHSWANHTHTTSDAERRVDTNPQASKEAPTSIQAEKLPYLML